MFLHADPWALGPLRVFENVCVSVMALPLETTAPDVDHSSAKACLTGRSVAGRFDRHVNQSRYRVLPCLQQLQYNTCVPEAAKDKLAIHRVYCLRPTVTKYMPEGKPLYMYVSSSHAACHVVHA